MPGLRCCIGFIGANGASAGDMDGVAYTHRA